MEVPWKYIAGIQPRLPTKPHMLLVTVGGITCQVAGFTLGGDRRCQGASKSIHHLTVNCGRISPVLVAVFSLFLPVLFVPSVMLFLAFRDLVLTVGCIATLVGYVNAC
jgi:hypothetical protein